jgi:hypothetical protein
MNRKLASVQKILNISPIEGADLIEKATVLGWEVVIGKKDNFKIGDLVIYIEVDSIMPEKPEYEFLRDRKFRVRTIKLKKQISQGLVLPLSVLGSHYDTWHKIVEYQEGDDVTALIGVRKYDPEGDAEQKLIDEKVSRSKSKLTKFLSKYPWYRRIFMTKKSRGGFPKFIHKTDEDRIQLFPHICENEKDTIFSVTEKIDGQSGTWFLVKNHNRFLWFGEKYIFGVCSRNLYLPKPNNSSYWTVAKKYDIKNMLTNLIGDHEFVAIQGECVGPGIQGNKYKKNDFDMYVFNVVFPDRKIHNSFAKVLVENCGMKFVPILDDAFVLKNTISENVDYAKGKSVLVDCLREGVVVRNYEKNLSFKIINPEFLLKFDE